MRNSVFSILALLGVAACGDLAASDPSAFSVDRKGLSLTGAYNPAGWSSDRVQVLIPLDNCASQKLASYSEELRADGLVVFSAMCEG